MNIRQFISALTLLVAAGTVSAGVVKVELNTGLIKPGETIVINLDKFIPQHTYTLSCALTSNHTSGNPYNVVQVTTPSNTSKLGVTSRGIIFQAVISTTCQQIKIVTLYGDISKEIGNISIDRSG